MLVVLASLLLLHRLQPHPLFVAICALFVHHHLFVLFASVKIPHMRNFLGFIDLLLHQPIIHSLATRLILLSLLFSDSQQLFFYLVLRLADEFTFETFLSIFGFKPVLVTEALSPESSLSIIQILLRTRCRLCSLAFIVFAHHGAL